MCDFGNIKNIVHQAVKAGISEGANLVLSSAKIKCPVKSGALRNSLNVKLSDSSVSVGTNLEYAPHVEYGHRIVRDGNTIGYAEEHPYMRPALEENEDNILNAVLTALEDVL